MAALNKKRLIIGLLLATNILTATALAYYLWRDHFQWRTQSYGMAGYAASLQARTDFENGKRRLLELSLSEESKFTGRTDGPFEIWTWVHYPALGGPHTYVSNTFVEFYNRKMRYMQENPDEFRTDRTEPDDAP
jgi:hypothetical protein